MSSESHPQALALPLLTGKSPILLEAFLFTLAPQRTPRSPSAAASRADVQLSPSPVALHASPGVCSQKAPETQLLLVSWEVCTSPFL